MLDSSTMPYIAKSEDKELFILPKMANRHGLIAGATGTGKTVSLQVIAESFSALGVPVFITDVKGDLSGISKAATPNDKIQQRVDNLKLEGYTPKGSPVCFWDIYGELGHPVRTTISEMGPLLLGRLLDLNDTQSGVLTLVFKIADENNLLLLDMKDLQKMLEFVGNNRSQFITKYGNISAASIGSIQRSLLQLEAQGGSKFFGEPALDIGDFLQTDKGKGVVNILSADKLMNQPRSYSTLLLWLLSDLFERLPEVGDLDKPKLVFFFDEAHLLFNDTPKALLEKIEQVVRLIRSKGVGVYFITQNPSDIPDTVLGQLGNRIQHALRAYTPKDQKAVRTAAQTFRANPKLNVEQVITELGVGEALVSFLDEKGVPVPVERATVLPPESQIGPITADERARIIRTSVISGVYEKEVDRESAYEILSEKIEQQQKAEDLKQQEKEALKRQKEELQRQREAEKLARSTSKRKSNEMDSVFGGILQELTKQTTRSVSRKVSNELGKQITRGLFGTLFGGK